MDGKLAMLGETIIVDELISDRRDRYSWATHRDQANTMKLAFIK